MNALSRRTTHAAIAAAEVKQYRLPNRIAYALPPHATPQEDTEFCRLATLLTSVGYSLIVVAPYQRDIGNLQHHVSSNAPASQERGVRFIQFDPARSRDASAYGSIAATTGSIREILQVFKPSFVIACGGHEDALPAALAAEDMKLAFIYDLRCEYPGEHLVKTGDSDARIFRMAEWLLVSSTTKLDPKTTAPGKDAHMPLKVPNRITTSDLLRHLESKTQEIKRLPSTLSGANNGLLLPGTFYRPRVKKLGGPEFLKELETLASALPDSNGTRHYSKHKVSVAIITDEFMYNYYKDAFESIDYIKPSNYEQFFNSKNPDLLIFVTCWHGLDDQEWTGATFTESLQSEIKNIRRICKERSIPTVFQSIEDPSNYHKFIGIAKGFDYIFTSDINKIEDYKRDCGMDNVFYGEYGVNPLFNNPIGHRAYRIDGAFFAGSYPARYKERCDDMKTMFDALQDEKITLAIANRNSDDPIQTYQYPEKYSALIVPKVGHKMLQKIHKLFRYNVNFNSIKHSVTMCAMRVYELQAQGSLILSNYSKSVANRFPNIVIHNAGSTLAETFVDTKQSRFAEYEREVRSIRAVLVNKTVFEQSAKILNHAGIAASIPQHKVLVLCDAISDHTIRNFHHQTYPFCALSTLEGAKTIATTEYGYIAYFSPDLTYECDYISDMVCAFKYTKADYVTKHAYFEKDRYVDGIQNTYTSMIGQAGLTLFVAETFDIHRIISLIRSNRTTILPGGYATHPFGVNYSEFCRNTLRASPAADTQVPLITIVVPLHGANETLIYRVIDGIRDNKIFDRLEILFWIPGDVALVPGSLLSIQSETYDNIAFYKSKLNVAGLRDLLDRTRAGMVSLRLPGVQTGAGQLDGLWESYEQCKQHGNQPNLVMGHEMRVGETSKHAKQRSDFPEGMLSDDALKDARSDFTLATSLVQKQILTAAVSELKEECEGTILWRTVASSISKIASKICYSRRAVSILYDEDLAIQKQYDAGDLSISDYNTGYPIYFLYADKWWISASWSGASVNVINEMFVLAQRFAVFYNDVYLNDLFSENGTLDEKAFISRYQEIISSYQPAMSAFLPKVIKPTRKYYASFYRGSDSKPQINFFMNEICEPKIYSHNYVKEIWESSCIGFQNSTAVEYAKADRLRDIGDDGTLNYESIAVCPHRQFIRHQAITNTLLPAKDIDDIATQHGADLRKRLNSEFVVGIGGTVTKSSYPSSLIFVLRKLRNTFPTKNISLVVYALNVLEALPDEPWIHVSSYKKDEQASALLAVDVLVNPWRERSQAYFASNRTLDAVALGIPYITPRTDARIEQLGDGYPLFHDFCPSEGRFTENVEAQIESLLIKCMDTGFKQDVREYMLIRRAEFSAAQIVKKYEDQLQEYFKRKVLIVVGGMGVGGVEHYTIQMLECLKFSRVTIFSAEPLSTARREQIRRISPFIRILENEGQLTYDYDLAFLNSFPIEPASLDQMFDRLYATGCRIYPIVHTDIHAFTVGIAKHVGRAHGIITVAGKIIEKLEKNTGIQLAKKSHLITPSVDYHPKQLRSLPKAILSYKIGYFGRVVSIKGVHLLVKFFCRLLNDVPVIQHDLHIFGPFGKESYYRQVLNSIDSKYSSRVTLHNQEISPEKRESLLRELDVLVYTTAMDGLPYSYLEAMALGTPVVSTRVGGIEHLIEDGVNGRLLDFSGLYVESLSDPTPYNTLLDQMNAREDEYYKEFKRVMGDLLTSEKAIAGLSAGAVDTVFNKFTTREMNICLQRILFSDFHKGNLS
jgi:glycosyltransferase involved in cell wall biosynthesis